MPNLFCKIHRLKAQGWTWDRFLLELEQVYAGGVDEKTLKSHYRQPHKRSASHTQQLIETLHKQCFPSPFPADAEALMRIYNNLIGCQKHVTKASDIADLRVFLSTEVEREHKPLLRSSRLCWLLANTYFDCVGEYRQVGKKAALLACQQQAIHYYQQAIALIEQHNQQDSGDKVSEFILYKVRQNILACYLNAIDPEQRESDLKVLNYLAHSDYLTQSERVLVQEPYLWVVARNGLRFGSLLKSREQCERFFGLLVTSSAYFEDLGYSPLGYPAISESKEFEWACKVLKT
ncbi:hypothetical protein [Alkalimarinus alittae]|uniref:Uncharacterized protein n=1 Tax=Alkalimarinus alittae TaxID=2961619 RepID=A0ABY6N2W2_9ALTE|nr:hypothetical protein [Alkalimarinus alittae]UZE96385.1 hypothetical protein NKI27_01165 [Alkalimarinus alittae]